MTGAALLVAQTVVLLSLAAIFVGLVLWLFRPGAGPAARRDAEIPFREDRSPGADGGPRA